MEADSTLGALERLQREIQSAPTQIVPVGPEGGNTPSSASSNEPPQEIKRRRTKSKGPRPDGRRRKRSMSTTKLHESQMAVRAPNTSLEALDMISKHLLLVLTTDNGVQLRNGNEDIDLLYWTMNRLHRRFCAIESGPTALADSKDSFTTNPTTKRLDHCARKLVMEIGEKHSSSLTPSLLSLCFLPKFGSKALAGPQKPEPKQKSPRGYIDPRKRSQSENNKKGVSTASQSQESISRSVLQEFCNVKNSTTGAVARAEPSKTPATESILRQPKPAPMPSLPSKPSIIMDQRADSAPISRESRSKSPIEDSPVADHPRVLRLPSLVFPNVPEPEVIRRPFKRENSKNEGEGSGAQLSSSPQPSVDVASTPPLPMSPLSSNLSPSSSASSVSKPFKRRADAKVDGDKSSPSDLPSTSSGPPEPFRQKRHLKRSSSDAGRPEEPTIVESIDWKKSPVTARAAARRSEFEPSMYPSAVNGSAYSLDDRENPLGREQPTSFASTDDMRKLEYKFRDDYIFGATGFDDDIDVDGADDGNVSDASASSVPNSARSDGEGVNDDDKLLVKPRRRKSSKGGNKVQQRIALPQEHLLTPSHTSPHCRFVFSNLFSEFNFVFSQSTWEDRVWPAFQRLDSFILSHIVYGASSTSTAASDSKNGTASPGRSSSASNIIRAWSGPNIAASGSSGSLQISSDSIGSNGSSKSSEKSKSPEKARPKEKSKHNLESGSASSGQKVSAGRMMAVSEWSWGVFWILFRRYCSALIETAAFESGSSSGEEQSPAGDLATASKSNDSQSSSQLPAHFDEDTFTRFQSILRYNVMIHQQSEKCYDWRDKNGLTFDTVNVPLSVLSSPSPSTGKSTPDAPKPNPALAALSEQLGMPLVTKDEAATKYYEHFFRQYLSKNTIGQAIALRLSLLHSNKYEAELKLANATLESGFSWSTKVDYDLVCLGSSFFSESKSRSCTIL